MKRCKKLTVLVNVIVRGDIVDEVFAAVRDKTAVKLHTVRILRRHVSWLHPALDVTIQIILKIILIVLSLLLSRSISSSCRTRRSNSRFDRVKNSTLSQTDGRTDRQSDFLGFLSKPKIVRDDPSLTIKVLYLSKGKW